MLQSGVRSGTTFATHRIGVAGVQRPARATVCRAESSNETLQLAAGVTGCLAAPLCLYSEFVLKTTGSGLPPGPGGLLGAAEGVSYLVVVGLVGWSAYTKVQTGSGLPAGPSGLLGGAEGLSYLALLAGIIVFGLNAVGV